jgi:hypothetical protein
MKTRFITTLNLCFALILLLATTSAFAQDVAETLKNRTPEQRAVALTQIMKAELKLDTVQTKKVQDINIKYASKTEAVMKGDGGKFAKFKQMKDIQKSKDAELKGAMNSDQFKQYQVMEQQMIDKVKEKMKNKGI